MEKESRPVSVFFYGTFMNPKVLAAYGIAAGEVLLAKLTDFELCIRPRVNLVASKGSVVYGSVARITPDDLDKIYSDLEKRYGLKYLPEPVLAEMLAGPTKIQPALCYIASYMPAAAPAPEYVKELADCARALNLPESYALHIESFAL